MCVQAASSRRGKKTSSLAPALHRCAGYLAPLIRATARLATSSTARATQCSCSRPVAATSPLLAADATPQDTVPNALEKAALGLNNGPPSTRPQK